MPAAKPNGKHRINKRCDRKNEMRPKKKCDGTDKIRKKGEKRDPRKKHMNTHALSYRILECAYTTRS